MEDPLDMRDELEIESSLDDAPRRSVSAPESRAKSEEAVEHSYSLFANREEEPDLEEVDGDSPVDLLLKSGQPRLALVREEDELDDDGGLIELAPVDPTPIAAETEDDSWPWLSDIESATNKNEESPSLASIDGMYASDLIGSEHAPTACGARPTSMEVNRRPMPSLPRAGEIAAVAQRVGAQFATEARSHRTPEVPALLSTMPKTFTPAAPVMISTERATSIAPSTPIASTVSMAPAALTAPSVISSLTAATTITGPSSPIAPRKSPDTPKRIGDGKLIQSRLTWKPGNPFADPARTDALPGRFRWELMLSTACGTAVFGLAFFWIMRMVF